MTAAVGPASGAVLPGNGPGSRRGGRLAGRRSWRVWPAHDRVGGKLDPPVRVRLSALAQSTAPVVLETGPHHRLVEWVEERLGADGQLTAEVHQYTELATGLHYWDEEAGQWLESVEAFELLPQGYAVARRGQHKVLIAGNINAGGSVDLELPDGRRLLSNPMGLSYFDASSGRNVLLAEVKDCTRANRWPPR
jgi:hypothetical protein